MNYNQCVVAGIALGLSAVATKNYLDVRRRERAKREQIKIDLEKDLAAIRTASSIIREKIQHGDYSGKYWHDIELDYKFYMIASRQD